MNYLTELLAFYRWLEVGRLGPLLQSFWHLLMFFNNKAAVRSEDGRWFLRCPTVRYAAFWG